MIELVIHYLSNIIYILYTVSGLLYEISIIANLFVLYPMYVGFMLKENINVTLEKEKKVI